MSKLKHIPLRTCLTCRNKKEKSELVRFVLSDEEVRVDAELNLPGRGAYTCANETCFQMAIKRKGFNRAFRQEVQINAEHLAKEFSACLKKK